MFPSYSKFLVIILALLQLVAPLIHAHTGEGLSRQGIHLPELAVFAANHDEVVFSAIDHPDAKHCLTIDIDFGIQNNKKGDKETNQGFLPISSFLLRTNNACSQVDYSFLHRPPPFVSVIRLFTCRAPPASVYS